MYDGDRTGFNPTVKIQLSDRTTLDLSYEYADHERFIDRGIPTANGKPVTALKNVVFGTSDINVTTLEADIFRGTVTTDFSDSSKGIFSITSSEFEKMYQNLYASGYDLDTNVVTLDGYRDPTERENLIMSANLVNELQIGSPQLYLSVQRLLILITLTSVLIPTGLQHKVIKNLLMYLDLLIFLQILLELQQVLTSPPN